MIKRKIFAVVFALMLAFGAVNVSAFAAFQDISITTLLEPSLEGDMVYPFSDGLAAVRVVNPDGSFRLGYVNRYGQFIIPLRDYPSTANFVTPQFSHGLVAVFSYADNAFGFFDTSGGQVVPFIYDDVLEFSDGLVAVSYDGLWGFLDAYGNVAIDFQFQRAGHFSEGRAPVMQNNLWGFVNTHGQMALPFTYDHYSEETLDNLFISPSYSEALAPIILNRPEGYRWGFLNLYGNRIASERMYLYVEGFTEGRALVMAHDDEGNEIFGFIDRNGTEVIPLVYSAAFSFSEFLAAVRLGDMWGFVDPHGNMQINLRYHQARSFAEGYGAVMLDGRWGFIDRWGNEVVAPIYHEVKDFSGGLAAVRQGEGAEARWGFVDHNGNVVVPIEHMEVVSFSEGIGWVRGTAGWGILQVNIGEGASTPDANRYIHQSTSDYMLFSPSRDALLGVYDAYSADERIFSTLRGLSPAQRSSGDALNIIALFVENTIRRGNTTDLPDDGLLQAGVLHEQVNIGQNIWQDATRTVANEGVNLMRPLSLNLNFVADNPMVNVIFPDDVSGIAFDNVTIEAGFASITIPREFIPRASEITIEKGIPTNATTNEPLAEAQEASSGLLDGFNIRGILDVDISIEQVSEAPIDFLLEYWAVAVIILLILLWIILAIAGHRFRLWVVPTFAILAIVANAWTLGLFFEEDRTVRDLPPGYFYSVEVTLFQGMRATVSIPVNGADPKRLVLYNETGEAQHSKYNPVTDTIDARIRHSGTFTLLQHETEFDDIDGLSPIAQEAIVRLASIGILEGMGESFRPASAITRGEFTAALVEAFDLLDESAIGIFLDSSVDDRYYRHIASAANLALMHGFEDGDFRGSWAITKNDMFHAIAGALTGHMGYFIPENIEELLGHFEDRESFAPWAEPAIALSVSTNILLHRDDGVFAPGSIMTRGDAAVVIYRLLDRLW
ncbi:MAG: WG repeat-containing protein [Defluviitaleaceae bacterium]|nr:WG repeat-containing protein [Defluviitaleaceae bacterium]